MSEKTIPYKIYLGEDEMPRQWYNVRADMKNKPAPLLNPGTLQPMTFEELSGVFCDELVKQELNDTDAYIDIPQEIQDFYKMYRPAPLVRAYCLEKKLDSLPNNLSGGQQQRVAIARALASKPAIILADEPTGNLDSKTSDDVIGLLKMTSKEFNQTIVMITHNPEIAQMADRIVRIEDGRIASQSGRAAG